MATYNHYIQFIDHTQPKSTHHLNRYIKFIDNIIQNPNHSGQYLEKHHILPKSMFPEFIKSEWNIIKLTARQHFIAHMMLWLAYRNPEMSYAFVCMYMKSNNTENRVIKINSKIYENLKVDLALSASKRFSKLWEDPVYRNKNVERLTGSSNPMYGRTHSNNVKEKLRENVTKRNRESRWWNDGELNKFCNCKPGPGWKLGRLNQKPTNKGKHYYNNGISQISAFFAPDESWKPGMLPSIIESRRLKLKEYFEINKVHWITDGVSNKRININSEIPYGWRKGRIK